MRARIHRGAREIGGSCVELEHAGARVLLDLGLPLDAQPGESQPLPQVRGLGESDPSMLGVIVSHSHADHYGLVPHAHSSVPIYVGAAAERILREAAFFTPSLALPPARGHLFDRAPFAVGPFTITPYLVDHSAFDSYALLVEAGGQRLLYTGDLRGHGRKGALLDRLVERPPAEIDALLLEGTHVRAPVVPNGPSESDVEQAVYDQCCGAPGAVLACFSPQNIDRLVSVYRAARRARRTLVLDLYGASIASATDGRSIPRPGWAGVRVYVPNSQRARVKRSNEYDRVNRITRDRISSAEMARRAPELVVTFRASMARELHRAGCLEGAAAVWSMWPGYLDRTDGRRLQRWLGGQDIPLSHAHASGHARVGDLRRLASAMRARQLVPIHTSDPERFKTLFSNVVVREDGEWWDV